MKYITPLLKDPLNQVALATDQVTHDVSKLHNTHTLRYTIELMLHHSALGVAEAGVIHIILTISEQYTQYYTILYHRYIHMCSHIIQSSTAQC